MDSLDKYFKPVNELNPYLYTGNNPIDRIDPFGLWYIDINLQMISPWWFGVTGGAMINEKGIWWYAGPAFGVPGPGASITYSDQDPSTGWNSQVGSGFMGYGLNFGYDLNNNPYAEQGISTPGGSYTWFFVGDPDYWPWYRKPQVCPN